MTIVENFKNMNLNEIEIDIIDRINTVYTYDITEPDSIDMYGFAVYCYCKLRNHYADFPIEELKSESDHFDFELSPQMESVYNNASFANEKYDIDHQGVALEYLKKNYHLYYDEEDYDKEDSSENWDDPNGIHYELLDDSYERICAAVDTSTFKKLSIGVTNAIEKKDILIPEWFDGTVYDEGEFTVNPDTGQSRKTKQRICQGQNIPNNFPIENLLDVVNQLNSQYWKTKIFYGKDLLSIIVSVKMKTIILT